VPSVVRMAAPSSMSSIREVQDTLSAATGRIRGVAARLVLPVPAVPETNTVLPPSRGFANLHRRRRSKYLTPCNACVKTTRQGDFCNAAVINFTNPSASLPANDRGSQLSPRPSCGPGRGMMWKWT
jgi:hypothetical protein